MTDNSMDQFFRERLEPYSSPVDPELFSTILQKRGKRRKRPIGWIWIPAIILIVAAGAYFIWQAGGFTYNQPSFTEKQLEKKKEPGPDKPGMNSVDIPRQLDQGSGDKPTVSNESLSQDKITEIKNVQQGEKQKAGAATPIIQTWKKGNTSIDPGENRQLRNQKSNLLNAGRYNHQNENLSAANNQSIAQQADGYTAGELNRLNIQNKFFSLSDSYVKKDEVARGMHFPFCVPPCNFPDCPDFHAPKRNDWYVEVFGALDFPFKQLENSSSKSDFAQRKDSTESMLPSFTAGLRISRNISNNWLVKTGLHYSRINEKFEYRNENERRLTTVITIRTIIRGPGDTLVVADTSVVEQTGTRIRTTYNKYQNLDIPLILSYEIRNPSFTIGVQGGLLFNLRSWYEGDMLDTLLVPMSSVPADPKKQFKSSMGLGVYAGVSLIIPAGPQWDLFAEPYYRKYLQNHAVPEAPFKETIGSWGIQAGIRYKINKGRQRNY